jgi:endonuclease/exonuclease/phosphatase (EEP) superfamily protein YafD
MVVGMILTVLVCFACLWTLLPLFRHDAWWIRAFEFPRVQVSILSGVILLAYSLYVGWHGAWDIVLLAALLGCIVFQLFRIARYTRLYPVQLKSTATFDEKDTLSVLVANVLMPNRNSDALLSAIRSCNPDIVLTLETDAWWEGQLEDLKTDYPHAVKYPLDNLYGIHLYSRLALINPKVRFLVEEGVPSIHSSVVLRSGHQVDLHCLHPAPPSPTENATSAERDAELLIVAKTIEDKSKSVVVMGDLNDVAWSTTTRMFQRISQLLDPRIGRGMYSTFHAGYAFLRWPLDHVFCSADFKLLSLNRLGPIGSDHFPIHVVLAHSPAAADEHDTPSILPADHAEAAEKISKVVPGTLQKVQQ